MTDTSDRLVTVFGASGFIGRYVVRALAKAGYRVRAAVRHPGTAHFLRPMGVVGQVQIVQANVRVPSSVDRALEGAWGVVNLVGVLAPSGPQSYHTLHVQAPATIAELARRRGVQALVHVSALGAREGSASLYQASKAAGEAAVLRAFPDAANVRPGLVFGPEDQFFNTFASLARFTPVLPLFGGGKTRFQPVFAGDVAAAVVRVLEDPAQRGKVFELGGPLTYSYRELMEEILRVTERKRRLQPLPMFTAKLAAFKFMFVPSFIMKPLITFDTVKQLASDIVVAPAGVGTFADLGIAPRALEVELPAYLWRYRKSGQFEVSSYA